MVTKHLNDWQGMSLLGGLLLAHGLAIAATILLSISTPATAGQLAGWVLLSAACTTTLASVLMRRWFVGRIFVWMGGLRLAGAFCLLTALALGPFDHRYLMAVMMGMLALLEYLAASQLRRAEQSHRPLQYSALVGILTSAVLMSNYASATDIHLTVLSGFGMAVSGAATLSLAIIYRRLYRASRRGMATVLEGMAPLVLRETGAGSRTRL